MESLVDLLPLLFIGLYYLLTSRRKARLKQAARTRAEAPQEDLISSEPNAPTPFQAFLEQLEEAMAESAEGSRTELTDVPAVPKPAPIPAPRLETIPVEQIPARATPDFRPVAGSFDSPVAVDHDQHGFGQENPLSEEVFERQPAFSARRRRANSSYDPHGLRSAPNAPPPARDWHRRLQHPAAARDAFVLQTIFGARGGVGRGGRPGRR